MKLLVKLALVGVAGLAFAYATALSTPYWFKPKKEAQVDIKDPGLMGKGEYLAHAGDCIACHTAPGGKPFAGVSECRHRWARSIQPTSRRKARRVLAPTATEISSERCVRASGRMERISTPRCPMCPMPSSATTTSRRFTPTSCRASKRCARITSQRLCRGPSACAGRLPGGSLLLLSLASSLQLPPIRSLSVAPISSRGLLIAVPAIPARNRVSGNSDG